MTDENHNANTTSLAAAQLKTSTPEDPTKDHMISEHTGLHVLPNLNNPFDLPNGKQVQKAYDHTTEKELIAEEYEVETKNKSEFASDEHNTLRKRRAVCGYSCLPPIALLGIVAVVVILAIALGVGLGVGLKKSHSSSSLASSTSSPSPSPTASPTPSYLSKTGVFNGTSLALGSTTLADQDGQVELYFQHHTGEIRWLRRSYNTNDSNWTGGDEAVVTDARNSTPLSIVTNTVNSTATWHLFYVDTKNTIREKVRQLPSTIWSEGPLSNLQLTVMDSPHVVFQFCSDVVEILDPKTAGIQAFYATDPQTIQQINWVRGSNKWTPHEQLTANGHAGMACYTWGPGTVQYKMFVNLDNEVNLMWKDLNTTIAPNATHPINSWTNSTVAIPGVLPITNLAYNDYLVMQMSDGSLVGHNITFNAEHTQWISSDQFQLEDKALDGTHIWLWDLPTESGDKQLTLFNQLNGSDITLTLRDMVTGQSLTQALLIPDS